MQLPLGGMELGIFPLLIQTRRCRNKWSLFLFYVQRRVLGSGMKCNLPLKVVDFVDLCSFMFLSDFSFKTEFTVINECFIVIV